MPKGKKPEFCGGLAGLGGVRFAALFCGLRPLPPRFPRRKAGDPQEHQPDHDQVAEQQATPMHVYLAKLREIGSYTVQVVDLTSSPLPECRPRTWFLGSRCADFDAAAWKKEVLKLSDQCDEMPVHTMASLFDRFKEPLGGKNARGRGSMKGGDKSWQQDASYSQHFAAAIDKGAKHLPAGFQPKVVSSRPSRTWPGLSATSPWFQAQVDAYDEIISAKAQRVSAAEDACAMLVGDVSQSCNRCHLSLNGIWNTLTTSSKLVRFGDDACLLAPQGHLEMLGFATSSLTLLGLSDSDVRELAGNAMSFSQVCKVLLPILIQIGCLRSK